MAGNAGGGGSSGRHVWFQGLQQQQQQGAMAVMPFVEAGPSAGRGRPMGSGTSAATSGSLYMTAMSSSSNAVLANGDSRRSSLCESSTSSVMVGPVASGMQLSGNSAYNSSARNSLELGTPAVGGVSAAAAAGSSMANNAGLADMSSMQMLVSSLMAEIQNSRQEAMDSRNAAVQAQQQLKVITEALSAGAAADAAGGQAGQLMGSGAAAAAAAHDQLQQRAMMQRAASGLTAFPDAATAAGMQLAGAGLTHAISNGSNMSCSGNWAAAAAAGMVAGLPSASAAAPDAAVASLQQAVAHRLSLEQAAAAAGGAATGSSNYGMLPGTAEGQLQGYAVPSSYAIAAGNAGCMDGLDSGAGVMNWLQLLPPAQGLDTAIPVGDFSTASAGVGSDMVMSGAAGVATAGTWRNSFEAAAPVFGLAPAAAAAAVSQGLMTGAGNVPVTVALPLGGNGMQQQQLPQQQLTSDYLLRLQQQHALLSAPELAFAAPGGMLPDTSQQQQQQVVRSAPVMLQGWQGTGRVACVEDCINSSGTLEGLISPSVDVPAGYTTSGGNRQLGWL
jgi:hypothetical protein